MSLVESQCRLNPFNSEFVMAVIFPATGAPAPDPNNAKTHALIIGIGGYTHLQDGKNPKDEIKTKIGALGQLTTSPRSALAMAEFIINAKDNWPVPLGSVDLILSAKPGDEAVLNGHDNSATLDDIEAAYEAWRARCDSHVENVALFYFCGHGVEKEEQILLTEDFGKSTANPWKKSFALDSTILGFRSCKANTQCFFIDACREITSPLKNHTIVSNPLDLPRIAEKESEFTFVMKSTAGKETALGPKEGVAYATQALIRAMKGGAAVIQNNKWIVRTGTIADKITDILGMVNDDEHFRQRCPCSVTKSTNLLTLDDIPDVRLNIGCDPEHAIDKAKIICQEQGNNAGPPHIGDFAGLSVDVKAGFYFASAEFPGNEFEDSSGPLMAVPPMTDHLLECKQLP